jgi:glycosyltransferase involved in cell wall biosynthesis
VAKVQTKEREDVPRTLILVAYSSNSGGGRSGLLSLLAVLPDRPAVVFVDERTALPFALPTQVRVERVPATVWSRFMAERRIKAAAKPDTWIFRLGSVPPFFSSPAPTFVFFENRHLVPGTSLEGMPWSRRARVFAERLLIKLFARNAITFLVQSLSMAEGLKRLVGSDVAVQVVPFHSTPVERAQAAENPAHGTDFIYTSTGDPHKNHRGLIAAWIRLAQEGLRPSLTVTVSAQDYPALAAWIAEQARQHGLNVTNIGFVPPLELLYHYARSRALIFPSTCESFGRPLMEAKELGLPVLASELDYVRDLLDPAQTFDPASPLSIARAVKRFLDKPEQRPPVLNAVEFLTDLQRRADAHH